MALNLENIVANPDVTTPSNLSVTLTSNNVIVHTLGTNVYGVAFPAIASYSGSSSLISIATNTRLKINNAYNGTTFALIYNDRSSTTFTVVTANGGAYNAQSLATTSFDVTTPEDLRLRNLGYC
jgi:hypothetical protein